MTCAICLETPKVKLLLQCKHTFCFHCIHTWSLKCGTCPCCRSIIKKRVFKTMKSEFLNMCNTIMRQVRQSTPDERGDRLLDFFRFLVKNEPILGIMKDNSEFMELMIQKYENLGPDFDQRLLLRMIKMNERFKENTGTYV